MGDKRDQAIKVELVPKEELEKIDKTKIVTGITLNNADVIGQENYYRIHCMQCRQNFRVTAGSLLFNCPNCNTIMRMI